MFHIKVAEKIKTHFKVSNPPPPPPHEILPFMRYVEKCTQPDGPQMTIWRMRIACWVRKTTNTHSEYVTLNAFPLQQLLDERVSMLRYTYIACLVRKRK
jgi:hypothetical protein